MMKLPAVVLLMIVSTPSVADPSDEDVDVVRGHLARAIRYAKECPGVELDLDRAMDVAQMASLPRESITAAADEAANAMIAPPLIGRWQDEKAEAWECEMAWDAFGPAGNTITGLYRHKSDETN